jgi:hypothetical protein
VLGSEILIILDVRVLEKARIQTDGRSNAKVRNCAKETDTTSTAYLMVNYTVIFGIPVRLEKRIGISDRNQRSAHILKKFCDQAM